MEEEGRTEGREKEGEKMQTGMRDLLNVPCWHMPQPFEMMLVKNI